MKDSSGSMVDFMHFMDKIRIVKEEMNFLTGREETLFACLMVGGKGCMTATSGILPEIMVGIYNAWKEGNYDRARELQFSILLAVRAMFAMPFPLGFKVALETRGFEMGPPKQPLSDAEQFKYGTVKARIEKIMNPILENLNQHARAAQGTESSPSTNPSNNECHPVNSPFANQKVRRNWMNGYWTLHWPIGLDP